MKSPALILFALVQMAVMFDFGPYLLLALTCLAVACVTAQGRAIRRPFDGWTVGVLTAALVSSFIVPWMTSEARGDDASWTLRLDLRGKTIEGKPLRWSDERVTVLGRDGRLWEFRPQEAKNLKRTSADFSGLPQGEMRAALLQEFGKRFDVSGTGSYLVVHPRGQRDQWAMRFEKLYRSFVHYFTVRGLRPSKPEFPLVAVVFPTQREFFRYAARTGTTISSGVLGYYSPVTNRILLFDVAATTGNEQHWHMNAETIIHEAAHQSAFNTGVHNRLHMPPRWVAEGLGTMFEATGVWDSRRFQTRRDRINKFRFKRFLEFSPRRPKGSLATFVSSDRIFRSDPSAAYAESWALTFFLAETRPREYARYLSVTAKGKGGMDAKGHERLAEFMKIFGNDLRMLEARYLRFVESLRENRL